MNRKTAILVGACFAVLVVLGIVFVLRWIEPKPKIEVMGGSFCAKIVEVRVYVYKDGPDWFGFTRLENHMILDNGRFFVEKRSFSVRMRGEFFCDKSMLQEVLVSK